MLKTSMCHATLCSRLIINAGAPHCVHLFGVYVLSAVDGELWLSGGQMWLVPTQVRCTRRFAWHALIPSPISMINLQITYYFFVFSLAFCLENTCISTECSDGAVPQRHFWLEYANWMGLFSTPFRRYFSLFFFSFRFFSMLVLAKFNYM